MPAATRSQQTFIEALPPFIVAEPVTGSQLKLHCSSHGIVPAPAMQFASDLGIAAKWLLMHLADDHGGLSRPEMWNGNLRLGISERMIEGQQKWSGETFGPGWRNGTVEHLKKECQEILDAWEVVENENEATLEDVWGECIDALILAIDLCWRSGMSPAQITQGYVEKRIVNEQRTWPDWRTANRDEAIEHVRTGDDVSIKMTRMMKENEPTEQMGHVLGRWFKEMTASLPPNAMPWVAEEYLRLMKAIS